MGAAALAGDTFTGAVEVPDDPYDATGWDGSTEVPTKNAVRDKIESLVVGGGGSLVLLESHTASASATLDFTSFVNAAYDNYMIEIVGLVRKNDLRDNAPGARIGNTRVVIGAPRTGDPMQSARAPISEGLAVMDATSIRVLDDRCPIVR